MKTKGRPILAAFAGFFFGLSVSILLLVSGSVKLDSMILAILPILFLVLGLIWGMWAPLGRTAVATAGAPVAAATYAPEAATYAPETATPPGPPPSPPPVAEPLPDPLAPPSAEGGD